MAFFGDVYSLTGRADIHNGKSLNQVNQLEGEAAEGADQASAQQKASEGKSPDAISSPRHPQNGNAPELEAEVSSGSPTDEEVDDTTQTSQMKFEPDVNTLSQVSTDELKPQDYPETEVAILASKAELSQGATANSQVTKRMSEKLSFTPAA